MLNMAHNYIYHTHVTLLNEFKGQHICCQSTCSGVVCHTWRMMKRSNTPCHYQSSMCCQSCKKWRGSSSTHQRVEMAVQEELVVLADSVVPEGLVVLEGKDWGLLP